MVFEVFVAVLATWQIIEIWHHSLLFASLRARTELWENKLGELLGCPFCLSPWVALFSTLILILPTWLHITGWHTVVLRVIWYAFAISRLANISNDLAHKISRTPKSFEDFLPDNSDWSPQEDLEE